MLFLKLDTNNEQQKNIIVNKTQQKILLIFGILLKFWKLQNEYSEILSLVTWE